MKNYEEIANTVFERRDAYVARQRQKRRTVIKITSAACVALTVGLWQGGVFDPATPPVDMPGDTTSTAEPTKDTTESTETPTTTTTEPNETTKPTESGKTSKSTTKKSTESSKTKKTTESTKTTVTTIDGKMVVFADEPSELFSAARPSGGYLHGTVKDKMELYKGQDVLYAVIVEVLYTQSDFDEFGQSPWDQQGWTEEWRAFVEKQFIQRAEKLKEITGKELISVATDDKYWGFYAEDEYAFVMELTAEEIKELDQCDCYFIRLRHPDGDDAAEIVIPA